MATAQQTRELNAWLDQYTSAVADADARTVAAVWAAYAGIDDWFDPRQTVPAALVAAETVRAAQRTHAGLMSEFIAFAQYLATGTRAGVQTRGAPEYGRRGVSEVDVYSRPVFKTRDLLDQGLAEELAQIEAKVLADVLAETDMALTRRLVASSTLEAAGVTQYRRVIRPELSKTGTCGLCIAAATRVYKTNTLMPIHSRCKCTVMPIAGGVDPHSFNTQDLEQLYAEIPATRRQELSTFRYQVQDNGELGPVLEPEAKQKTVPRLRPAS